MKKKRSKKWSWILFCVSFCAVTAFLVWRRRKQRSAELADLKLEDDLFEEGETDSLVQANAYFTARTIEADGVMPSLDVKSRFSAVDIDLSESFLPEERFLQIDAICSAVRVNVPEGVRVDIMGRAPFSAISSEVPEPAEEDAPSLYVYVHGCFSSVTVV
ncbi:MAG: hypothetical protein IJL66_02770 [Lachnospiraceae bacterium]|nr:hypothetical protein [Lachnospiraceae bacterium]